MQLPNIIKKYPFPVFLIVTGMIICGIIVYQIYVTPSLEEIIQSNQVQSQTHVTEAANSTNQAANYEVERRTEDGVREQVIMPKLQKVRAKSAQSAQSLKQAKQKLNETKNNLHNANANRAANCAELQSLFPDAEFEYCIDR